MGLAYFCLLAEAKGLGLFNLTNLNFTLEVFISVIIFDGLIYIQHVLSHKWDFLWKIHRVHHSDIDLDTTSALRFHPAEIVFSFIFKVFCIFIFGFSSESVFILEILLSSMAMFNHSNIFIPNRMERLLRLLVVTPQMHIIHHSIEQFESDSNYGFNLSIWDRIFKTYTSTFISNGIIGQKYARTDSDHQIGALLKMPFKTFIHKSN
jgi:sterol desaturase/sphingolipid hydroxylase (fatty acid hydroxylase superfamily)